MNNILVTGGAGFIGSNFIRYVLNVNPNIRIINLDDLTYAGRLENLENLSDPERYTFVKGNIGDAALVNKLLHEAEIDTVVHFAAETHVDRSILGPGKFIETNINGTFNLLEQSRIAWVVDKIVPLDSVRFHHVSTDEVFGSLEPDDPAWDESSRYDPHSPYSASKASSDFLVRAYSHTYGIPISITNCSNNYGPYQFPEKLIPLMILNALEGKDLPVYGDGRQVRDWLYVEDHCDAIYRVITQGRIGETYNIGGQNQPYNLDIVQIICDTLDEMDSLSQFVPHRQLIRYVKDRPGHDRRYAMDISKISGELGWKPLESLESGLKKTVRWYLDHMDWVKAIRDESDLNDWVKKNYTKRSH